MIGLNIISAGKEKTFAKPMPTSILTEPAKKGEFAAEQQYV